MRTTSKTSRPKGRLPEGHAHGTSPNIQRQKSTGATLIAVVGISPAILTETIWALANPRPGAFPIIPDDVIAITTVKGQKAIADQLLTPTAAFGGLTVWRALRNEILGHDAA